MAYWLHCQFCDEWSKSSAPLSEDQSCSFCSKPFKAIKPYQPGPPQQTPANLPASNSKEVQKSVAGEDFKGPGKKRLQKSKVNEVPGLEEQESLAKKKIAETSSSMASIASDSIEIALIQPSEEQVQQAEIIESAEDGERAGSLEPDDVADLTKNPAIEETILDNEASGEADGKAAAECEAFPQAEEFAQAVDANSQAESSTGGTEETSISTEEEDELDEAPGLANSTSGEADGKAAAECEAFPQAEEFAQAVDANSQAESSTERTEETAISNEEEDELDEAPGLANSTSGEADGKAAAECEAFEQAEEFVQAVDAISQAEFSTERTEETAISNEEEDELDEAPGLANSENDNTPINLVGESNKQVSDIAEAIETDEGQADLASEVVDEKTIKTETLAEPGLIKGAVPVWLDILDSPETGKMRITFTYGAPKSKSETKVIPELLEEAVLPEAIETPQADDESGDEEAAALSAKGEVVETVDSTESESKFDEPELTDTPESGTDMESNEEKVAFEARGILVVGSELVEEAVAPEAIEIPQVEGESGDDEAVELSTNEEVLETIDYSKTESIVDESELKDTPESATVAEPVEEKNALGVLETPQAEGESDDEAVALSAKEEIMETIDSSKTESIVDEPDLKDTPESASDVELVEEEDASEVIETPQAEGESDDEEAVALSAKEEVVETVQSTETETIVDEIELPDTLESGTDVEPVEEKDASEVIETPQAEGESGDDEAVALSAKEVIETVDSTETESMVDEIELPNMPESDLGLKAVEYSAKDVDIARDKDEFGEAESGPDEKEDNQEAIENEEINAVEVDGGDALFKYEPSDNAVLESDNQSSRPPGEPAKPPETVHEVEDKHSSEHVTSNIEEMPATRHVPRMTRTYESYIEMRRRTRNMNNNQP